MAAVDQEAPSVATQLASFGLGDRLPIARWRTSTAFLQLGIEAVFLAEFDLASRSFDFLDADFIVGLPFEVQRGSWSGRLRLYHQSSHVGDGLRDPGSEEPTPFDFESLEALVGVTRGALRAYGGGELRFRHTPDLLEAPAVIVGVDLRPRRERAPARTGMLRPLLAVHMNAWESVGWSPTVSAVAGIEIDLSGGRPLGLVLTLADGPSPRGRFYREDATRVGISLQLGRRSG